MNADEVYIGQPVKRRKFDDDLPNSAIDSCQESTETITGSIEDPNDSGKTNMVTNEVYMGQPPKRRKFVDNSSLACEVTVSNTQSHESEISANNSYEVVTELCRDDAAESTETPTESVEDTIDFTKDPTDFTQDPSDITKEAAETISVSQDKLRNLVSKEEMERLKQFHVLDEVKSNDEDSNDERSDESDGVEVPDEEVEMMLDADLPDEIKGAPKVKEKAYVTIQKTVLEEKGANHFEVLPMDWIMVRHISGMPIYMHRPTRVCTLSKPYFLGMNNTRRHDIPISAIPCYAYRRALEEEEKQKEIDKKIEEQIRNGTWATLANNSEINQKTEDITQSKTDVRFGRCPKAAISIQSNQIKGEASKTQNMIVPKEKLKLESTEQKISNLASQQTSQSDHLTTETISQNKESSEQSMSTDTCDDKSLEIDQKILELSNDIAAATASHTTADSIGQQSGHETSSNQSQELLEKAALLEKDILQGSSENKCPYNNGTIQTESKPSTSGIDSIPLDRRPVILPGGIVMPPPRVETIHNSWKTQHLTPEQITNYCKNLFKFKTINIMHFKRWAHRRKYTKARKTLQYPTLPEGTKLITIPAQPAGPGQDKGGRANKRDWVMNMNERSYLSVFHEYVGRALQKQPVYHFRQLENAAAPYQAVVSIGGMQYGVGYGSSKRQAKSAAARASIQILMPEMKQELDARDPDQAQADQPEFHDFFDLVSIEDPRITEFCAATCEPSPHAILRTCLLRNFGAQDSHIQVEMKKLEYQKIELTMKVGKHTASVICKNKKTAKQRASQAILQALHPHVRSWGSLLRLYGSKSVKSCKEKKIEEQQITLLQDKARHNEPNYAVLEKLRNEMRKLRERDAAVVPIGTLLVQDDLPTHSGSNLNNVEL